VEVEPATDFVVGEEHVLVKEVSDRIVRQKGKGRNLGADQRVPESISLVVHLLEQGRVLYELRRTPDRAAREGLEGVYNVFFVVFPEIVGDLDYPSGIVGDEFLEGLPEGLGNLGLLNIGDRIDDKRLNVVDPRKTENLVGE